MPENLKLSDFDESKTLAKGGIKQGGRHIAAVQYANNLLFKVGVSDNTFKYEMERWNKTLDPPLDEKELTRIMNDANKYFKSKSGEKNG